MKSNRKHYSKLLADDQAENLKEILYQISPHLHPRIIKSLSFDEQNLAFKIELNGQVSTEWISAINKEFNTSFEHRTRGGKSIIIINLSDHITTEELATYFQNLLLKTKQESYYSIARAIKNATDEFDYHIIEDKPGGSLAGVKFGNIFIKSLIPDNRFYSEFFTYTILHQFLGTKSPQVDLVKDANERVWMASRGLSQQYNKQEKTKSKTYSNLEALQDGVDIDRKSVAKIMILSVLLGLWDLHQTNIGIVRDDKNNKLSIVDHAHSTWVTPDFSNATSFEELLSIFHKKYKELNQFSEGNIIYNLNTDIESFKKAILSILRPYDEGSVKHKNRFVVNRGNILFHPKHESFADVIEHAYKETLGKLQKVDKNFHEQLPDAQPDHPVSGQQSYLEYMQDQKTFIMQNGLNLLNAVNSFLPQDQILDAGFNNDHSSAMNTTSITSNINVKQHSIFTDNKNGLENSSRAASTQIQPEQGKLVATLRAARFAKQISELNAGEKADYKIGDFYCQVKHEDEDKNRYCITIFNNDLEKICSTSAHGHTIKIFSQDINSQKSVYQGFICSFEGHPVLNDIVQKLLSELKRNNTYKR